MAMILHYLQRPGQRRRALAIISGGLIAAGLASGYILHHTGWSNGMMVAAALVSGGDIAWRAWTSLRNRLFSIELLVTMATIGALLIGEYWEAAAVTFLFIFGAFLEAQTLSRTRQVLGDLLELTPTIALVLRYGRQEQVAPVEVIPGEIVLLKPGVKVPVDGVVVDGHSTIDESAITGEPFPDEKIEGSPVYAGTVNQSGALKVRATGVGADTTLARIIHRVEGAQEEKAPTQRFIERFARWYTPFIMALSGLVFLISRDIELSLTLLVIGCPGALVISTPVSIVAGIGQAAKKGILIKGGEYLENAGRISAIAFDKTGTLTKGKPRLTDIIVLETQAALAGAGGGMPQAWGSPQAKEERWTVEQQQALRWAGIVEANSEHPLARSILEAATQLEGGIPEAIGFQTYPGKGVLATYRGTQIALGTFDWMEEIEVRFPVDIQIHLDKLKSVGKTAAILAIDGRAVGILGIADTLRDNAAVMARQLSQSGIQKIVMLTGEDQLTAQAIAREAGIHEVYAGLLPEGKLDTIRNLKEDGYVVAMAGDGINDTPALAAADIGIAMGAAGTGVAIETADIALMADDLMKIPEAIRLSKATLGNIRQNVTIALITVAILLGGVLVGEVHMAGGMLIHQVSVLVVILNAMRLMKA